MSRGKSAMRRCGWCRQSLGLAPDVVGEETTGICELCAVRLESEAALAHALLGLRAMTDELQRARAGIWPPGGPLALHNEKASTP